MVRVFRLCFIADVIDVFGPGKQENGFLEFIRQVRRREGERDTDRSRRAGKRSGPSRRLRKGPGVLISLAGNTVWRAPLEYRGADSFYTLHF